MITREVLDQLAQDVSGDQDIDDGHPRFFEHIALMSDIGGMSHDWQARIDRCTGSADTNQVARDGIQALRKV